MRPHIIIVLIFFIGFLGCDRPPQKRTYEEIVIHSSSSPSLPALKPAMTSTNLPLELLPAQSGQPKLTWTVPQGWIEKPGQGFRLATFVTEDADKIECSISAIGGMGDLMPNIKRWMQQINLTDVPEEKIASFAQNLEIITTSGGLKGELIDLSKLQENAPATQPSMIVVILKINSQEIFVKMTGSKAALTQNYEKFKALGQSLKENL